DQHVLSRDFARLAAGPDGIPITKLSDSGDAGGNHESLVRAQHAHPSGSDTTLIWFFAQYSASLLVQIELIGWQISIAQICVNQKIESHRLDGQRDDVKRFNLFEKNIWISNAAQRSAV